MKPETILPAEYQNSKFKAYNIEQLKGFIDDNINNMPWSKHMSEEMKETYAAEQSYNDLIITCHILEDTGYLNL